MPHKKKCGCNDAAGLLKLWNAGKKNKGGPRQRRRWAQQQRQVNGGGIPYFFSVAGARNFSSPVCFPTGALFFVGISFIYARTNPLFKYFL